MPTSAGSSPPEVRGNGKRTMVYRRTHQVVKRLAARRSAILTAARNAAAEGGMAAVQIAPVAVRANVAAGTVYRYFPSKADLISELIADVSRDELTAIRRAADAAPGPSSALAAAVTTVAVHALSQRKQRHGLHGVAELSRIVHVLRRQWPDQRLVQGAEQRCGSQARVLRW